MALIKCHKNFVNYLPNVIKIQFFTNTENGIILNVVEISFFITLSKLIF